VVTQGASSNSIFRDQVRLAARLLTVETKREVRYVQTGWTDEGGGKEFPSATDLPNLGIASEGSAINCNSFLIFPANDRVQMRGIGAHSI